MTLRRRMLAVAVLAAVHLAVLGTASAPAATTGLYWIAGTVTDALGRPLTDVVVSDGTRHTTTDVAGNYRLDEQGPGTYSLETWGPGLAGGFEEITLYTPGEGSVDFGLVYTIDGEVSPRDVSTASAPAVLSMALSTRAPNPGQPGDTGGASCLRVTDSRSGQVAPASLQGVGPDGVAAWRLDLEVPQGAGEGLHQLDIDVRDCADGTELALPATAYYVVDNGAPAISDPRPAGWSPATATVGVAAADALSGLDASASTIHLDGLARPAVLRQGRLEVQVEGLAPGPHHARAAVRDVAGNEAVLAFDFTVDADAPVLSGASPSGAVGDPSPEIAVAVADAASGVAAQSVVMTLSDGVRTTRVDARFDDATGTVRYQVPDVPAGIGPGQSPLLDGPYTVTVRVADRVGNARQLSWTFDVRTTPSQLSFLIA